MKSLADVLGVRDPLRAEDTSGPSNPERYRTVRGWARAILTSVQYRESLMRRIVMDELPAAIEQRLYDHAYGRPVIRAEVRDTTNTLRRLSLQELEDRALLFADLARQMRQKQEMSPAEEPPPPSVH